MFTEIFGDCPYKSPTDMGVNMAGYCIVDDEVCRKAATEEIFRRLDLAKEHFAQGTGTRKEVEKIEALIAENHCVRP
jgi:uncharacterized protein (UPF0371 family)